MDIFDKCYQYTLADDLKKMELYPYFHVLESRQDIEVIMENSRRIMLGSNNYLGLTIHEEVIEAGIKAVERYGTGCSGSRFLNGTLDIHIELEEELAGFLNKEAAVLFSTGYQSNLGILNGLVGKGDYVVCDRENHASIYDGCMMTHGTMLRYKHNDMNHLEKVLSNIPEHAGILIVTDGIFSMSGDIADLPGIVALAKKFGARIMVDDAHGLGVLGIGGRGTASYYGLEDEIDIYMGTFSKSLASLGGYMASSKIIAEYVRHNSRPFIFSASLTPASTACALAALRYLMRHPEIVIRLSNLSDYMRTGLQAKNITLKSTNTPIIPIYTYDMINTLQKAKALYEAGVYVNPVLPPAAAANECLLRTSYMASHTFAILDEAIEIISNILQEPEARAS